MRYRRKIYIDVGAYSGDSYLYFINRTEDWDRYEVYLIDPLPKKSLKIVAEDFGVNLIEKAAWIADGKQEMTVDLNDRDYGSTLMDKQYLQNQKKVIIETFDFSHWIEQFKNDYVIVKMDIEGAEFKILPKMLNDGTHKIINQLWLETHPNKIRDYTTTASDALFKRLRQDIQVEEWS